MAQAIKCFHEGLSLEPQKLCENLGMVEHTCHPSTGNTEAGRCWGCWAACLALLSS